MSAAMNPMKRRELVWLGHILLLALALRAATAALPRVIRWDEPDYIWLGKQLLRGQGYTINGVPELHYTPFLPILAGGIYLLTGNAELSTAFWYVVLGTALCVPIHALAARIYGRRIARLAALLVASFPALGSAILYWGTMTEPVFIFLVYSALWAVLVALERDSVGSYALAGLLLALAYLTRPEGIVWFFSYGALFGIAWALRDKLRRWRSLAQMAIYIAAFLLVASPYAAFLHRHSGRWLSTGKLSITYDIGQAVMTHDPVLYDKVTASLDEEGDEVLWWSQRRFERGLWDILLADPRGFARRIWENLRQARIALAAPTLFPLFLLAPIVLGWFSRPWTRRRLIHEAALWFTVLPTACSLPFHVEVRFFSPAFPAALMWVAAGLYQLGTWIGDTAASWRFPQGESQRPRHALRASWRSATLVCMMLLFAAYLGAMHLRVIRQGKADLSFAHKKAGLWLRNNTSPDSSIMSRDLAISLYADRGFVVSPRADYKTYLGYARRKGATHLVVDERELRVLRPHLAFLLDDAHPPPELEPAFSALDAHGRTIVYRIKD